jgi:hypothetical protein
MTTVKRMVCLANSRKLNGRCIAGRELVDGHAAGWLRPVSSREHQEVSEYERQYEDGSDPKVLDVIDVPLLRELPGTYQRENWLLDPKMYWARAGQATWDDLAALADPVAPLWVDGHRTYNGMNDKIPLSVAESQSTSLVLVRVPEVRLAVFSPGEVFGNPKRRVQARFRHASKDYRLWVTDPKYERHFLSQPNGDYELADSYLTVSLGEPLDGECYKLVAAIIEKNPTVGGHSI